MRDEKPNAFLSNESATSLPDLIGSTISCNRIQPFKFSNIKYVVVLSNSLPSLNKNLKQQTLYLFGLMTYFQNLTLSLFSCNSWSFHNYWAFQSAIWELKLNSQKWHFPGNEMGNPHGEIRSLNNYLHDFQNIYSVIKISLENVFPLISFSLCDVSTKMFVLGPTEKIWCYMHLFNFLVLIKRHNIHKSS